VIAVDANVLIYAHCREAREHVVAKDKIQILAEGVAPWAIP
jgi:predicted nucleic acid-binding protein